MVRLNVLIRDTQSNKRDLSTYGMALRGIFTSLTQCDLVALSVPRKVEQPIQSIGQAGEL